MANILRTRKDCTIFEADAWYRVESANLGVIQTVNATSVLDLTTTRYQEVTFANAGNFKGVDIPLFIDNTDRTLEVELQQGTVVTLTIANPGVVNMPSHGFLANQRIQLSTTGALPTGLTANSFYYVKTRDANSFYLSATAGGANINFTGIQSGVHTLWIKKSLATQTADNIRGGNWSSKYPSQDKYGIYSASFDNFDTVVAIDTTVGKWRFMARQTGGTAGRYEILLTGNCVGWAYSAYSDTLMTFNNGDTPIIGHYVDYSESFSIGGVLSLGDTANSWGGWILSNINDISVDNVSYLRCLNPSAPLTVTFNGRLVLFGHSGSRVGTKTNPIPRDKQVTFLFSTPTVGTSRCGFAAPYNQYTGSTAYYSSRHSLFFYGSVKTEMLNTLLTEDSPVGGKVCTISIANPALITYTAHGLAVNDPVVFSSTGSLPDPLIPFTTYYVSAVISTSTFRVSATVGGANISTLGSTQSGVQLWARLGDGADVPAVLNVADDVKTAGWEAGDLISIGKCKSNVGGSLAGNLGNSSIHTIASVSGNQITLTSALVNNQRLTGGSVFRVDERDFGIVLRDNNTANSSTGLVVFNASNINIEGCFVDRFIVASAGSRVYDHEPEGSYQQWTFKNCTHIRTGTGAYYFVGGGLRIPAGGVLVQNCHSNGGVPYWASWLPQVTPLYRSGVAVFDTITSHQKYNGYMGGYSAGKGKYVIKNHWITNAYNVSNACFAMASGNGSEIENIDLYGNIQRVNLAQLYFSGLCNGTKFKNITSNNSEYGLIFQSNAILQNCTFDNLDVLNNVTDFYQIPGWLSNKVVIKNSPDWVTRNYTDISNSNDGSNISFVNAGTETNNDRTEFTNGIIQRTGDSLTDDTTRLGGKDNFAMRFTNFISGVPLEWTNAIPTGDITNKTINFVCWVKINSANYWSGDHAMPRITATYDDGSTVYAQAAQVTGWQLLVIPVTPITNAGEISITFSMDTAATGSDGYVYFDDFGTYYPAGIAPNLGNIDIWANGLPVTPFIATSLNAADIWDFPTSQATNVGSFGEWVKKLLKKGTFIALK